MGEELCYNKMSVLVEEKSGGKNKEGHAHSELKCKSE